MLILCLEIGGDAIGSISNFHDCVSNALYIRWTMERKLCIDFGNVRNVQQICHYVAVFRVVDNSWQFTDTHNSNQQLNGRALLRWPITIPTNFDIKLFDLMRMWCGMWDVCYLRLRCAVELFLLKSNYLTRSKCGDSNYHYTCNNSNQWTRTTAPNDSLPFKLEKRNHVACEIAVRGLHSLFSLSLHKHLLSATICVCLPFLSLRCGVIVCKMYDTHAWNDNNTNTDTSRSIDNDIRSCSHPYLMLWLEIQLIVITIFFITLS